MTDQQQRALHALRLYGRPLTPAELARILQTSTHGAASTASSLVRNGLARRVRKSGRVSYEVIK